MVGMNDAMEFSKNMSKIAPHIMINGIKTSLITTYLEGLSYWYQFCCGIILKINITLNVFKNLVLYQQKARWIKTANRWYNVV